MDSNRETILDELNDFDKKRPSDISTILENYLSKIAKTGDPMFPWNKLKPLIRRKMEIVITEFHDACPTDTLPPLPNVDFFKYDDLREKILEAVDSFPNAPFTIQRLCELLTSPKKHYKRTDKFMRGLEKNILVVSTIEPRSTEHSEVNNNSTLIMNGIIESSAVADMLSAENINLTSHSVLNGTSSLSDSYHTGFSPEPGCIDPIVDSESSSSSDSDSSTDSLPPDYAKDSPMNSVVDSTSTLQVESTMETSQDLLGQNDVEERVSSCDQLKEKDIMAVAEMTTEDISSLVVDSTASHPQTSTRREDEDIVNNEVIAESSECQVDMANLPDEERDEIQESALLIEEVTTSLSQVLDATHREVPSNSCEITAECSSESEALPEEMSEIKTEPVEMEMTNEGNDEVVSTVAEPDPNKLEPMEED